MTVEEFLEIHPDEDVDLQVPEGRVLLDHGQVQRLQDRRTGRPIYAGGGSAEPGGLSDPSDLQSVAGIRGP